MKGTSALLTIAVSTDDVAAVRFAPNAVWEAFSSIRAICHPRAHLLHARLDKLVPAHPDFDMALLRDVAEPPPWVPDIFGPVPAGTIHEPLRQYDAMLDTDPEVVARDLATYRSYRPYGVAAEMGPDEFLDRLVTALVGYHRAVLAPLWDRVVAITEADIAYRHAALLEHGLGATMADLHECISYADAEISVGLSHGQTDLRVESTGSGVWFVPSVFLWPWVSVNYDSPQPVVSYAARGAGLIWERPKASHVSLASLIGRSRAAILEHLVVPRSTTWLAETLDLAPATVSAHLGVMSASGLLHSRKSGRHVLYARTQVADLLVKGESALRLPG